MSLVGNLEDVGLAEILQIVSLSRKSGVLRLHSRGRDGRIVFRQGLVIQATSSAFRESLGETLIRKGCLDLATLRQALSSQEAEGFRERVGTILTRQFGVPASTIDEVVREQIEKVVFSLFAWAEGSFDFELRENVETVDDTRMDPVQFMLDQGLNPRFLVNEGSRVAGGAHQGSEFSGDPAGLRNTGATEVPFDVPISSAVAKVDVVLVDDDEATRDAIAGLLEKEGYRVFPFSRSEDTLIQIDVLYRDGGRPALIVDLIMPRMDGSGILGGLELLEIVRNNFPELHAVVMSDYRNGDAERKLAGVGCGLVMKPLKGEIADGDLLEEFGERLFAKLGRPDLGKLATAPAPAKSDVVNLGDELRVEMGEVLSVAPETGRGEIAGMSLLRGMLEELNDPALGGGVTLLALRFAAEFMNRAVIFVVMNDELVGLGQFGIGDNGAPADARIRKLRIPRGEESLFAAVIASKFPAVVRPAPVPWNRQLFDQLGDGVPGQAFVGPIVSEGRVVAILYGDNLPGREPVRGTEPLEIFLSQAGVAMEKALLERRLLKAAGGGR